MGGSKALDSYVLLYVWVSRKVFMYWYQGEQGCGDEWVRRCVWVY